MTDTATIWHFLIAPFVFATAGVLWHLWRSIPLPWPDRLTDSPYLDARFIPGGYNWLDFIHDTDFDEDGYYRLDSWRNLRVTIGFMVFVGMAAMIIIPGCADVFASVVNGFGSWFWALLVRRVEGIW